jgi:hypothetical protein
MAITAAIGATAAAGVSTVAAVKGAKNAKKQQAQDMARLDAFRQEAEAQQKEYTDKIAEQDAKAAAQTAVDADGNADPRSARERQKAIAASSEGRRDTILTGPLGVPSSPASKAKKTLLGY